MLEFLLIGLIGALTGCALAVLLVIVVAFVQEWESHQPFL